MSVSLEALFRYLEQYDEQSPNASDLPIVAIWELGIPFLTTYVWVTGDFIEIGSSSVLINGNAIHTAVQNLGLQPISVTLEYRSLKGAIQFSNGRCSNRYQESILAVPAYSRKATYLYSRHPIVHNKSHRTTTEEIIEIHLQSKIDSDRIFRREATLRVPLRKKDRKE